MHWYVVYLWILSQFHIGPEVIFQNVSNPTWISLFDSVRKLWKLTQLRSALTEDLAKPLLDRFPLGTRFARKVIIPPSFNRCSSSPLAPRALLFAWHSPILSCYRIMFSNHVCYKFTIIILQKCCKNVGFEFCWLTNRVFWVINRVFWIIIRVF